MSILLRIGDGGNFMINRPFETMVLSQHPSFVAPSEHSWNSKDELPLGGGDSLSSSSPVPPFCCQHGVDCVSAKKTIFQPQNAAWTTEPLAFGANLRTGSQEGSHTMAYHEEPWAHSSEPLQDFYFQNSCFGKWPFIDSGTGTTIGWFQQKWTKHSTISNKFSLKNPGLLLTGPLLIFSKKPKNKKNTQKYKKNFQKINPTIQKETRNLKTNTNKKNWQKTKTKSKIEKQQQKSTSLCNYTWCPQLGYEFWRSRWGHITTTDWRWPPAPLRTPPDDT